MFDADTVMIEAKKVKPKREEMRDRRMPVFSRNVFTIEPLNANRQSVTLYCTRHDTHTSSIRHHKQKPGGLSVNLTALVPVMVLI